MWKQHESEAETFRKEASHKANKKKNIASFTAVKHATKKVIFHVV